MRGQGMIIDAVPEDVMVIGETWQFPNKDGRPGRRVKTNRHLPICICEEFAIVSEHGFKALLEI